ncbi:hypothetical protein CAPTEDRAFT_63634, partial [Capitella teleta]
SYLEAFMTSLQKSKESRSMTDVTLILSDQSTIDCHKLVLAMASPFFEAMFRSDLKENIQREVPLDFHDAGMIRKLVEYFYSGEIDINSDNVGDILTECEFFCLADLKIHCGAFMTSQVDSSNCLAFYRCARQYKLGKLVPHCFEHMLSHFKNDFCSSESFVDLSEEELIEVLSDDRLSVENEDIVLHSVVRWVEADLEQRRTAFVRIAPFIRFPFCTPELLGDIGPETLMTNNTCMELLREAAEVKSAKIGLHLKQSARCIPRQGYKTKKPQLFRVYGQYFEFTEELNGELTKWNTIPSKYAITLNHVLTYIQNKLFAFGGKINEHLSTMVDSFDQQSFQWKPQKRSMLHAVCKPYTVHFGTKLYVLGGIGVDGPSTVNQEFDPIWDKWQLKQSMPGVCESGAAVSLNTSIFVVGGAERACFRYTPTTDTW